MLNQLYNDFPTSTSDHWLTHYVDEQNTFSAHLNTQHKSSTF